MKRITQRLITSTALVLVASHSLPGTLSWAQSDDANQSDDADAVSTMDKVIVTTRRTAENLSEVPVSVSAISADEIQRRNIVSIDDIAALTPGLILTESSQPGGTNLSIRGLGVDLGRSPVAIRIDDVDLTAESIYTTGLGYFPNQRLLDLERIEVVKGAQVALYGRSAFGGAVNFITKRPSLDQFSGDISALATSEKENEITFGVDGPLSPGVLSAGFRFAAWEDGGSYTNFLSGDELGQTEGMGAALSLFYEPTSNFNAYARVEYSDEENGVPAAIIEPPNTTVVFPADVAAVLGSTGGLTFTGEVPVPNPGDLAISLDPSTLSDYPGVNTESFFGSLIMELDLGDIGIKSISGYLDEEKVNSQSTIYQPTPFVDATGAPTVPGVTVPPQFTGQQMYMITSDEIINQEVQIYSDTPDTRFRWQLGATYWSEELHQQQDQPTLIPLAPIAAQTMIDFFNANTNDGTFERDFSRTTDHLSAYAWFEYDLIPDKLSFSLEGRYSDEEITYDTNGTVNVSLAFSDAFILQVTAPPADQSPVTINESFFVPKGTLTYRPSEDHTLFFSAAKSVKPSGHASSSADQFNEFTRFDQEQLWSYEAGLKSSFLEDRLYMELSYFLQDYTDQQVATTVLDPVANVPRGATENAGESTRQGIDLTVDFVVSDNLRLSGNYVYVDTEFDDYEFFTSSSSTARRGPCVRFETIASQQGCIISWTGNQAGATPEHQLSAFANISGTVNDYDWFIEPNFRYTGERFMSNANLATLPEYTRVDLRAGITIQQVQLNAFVQNLFDDDTFTDANGYFDYTLNGFPSAPQIFLPDPRTFGVSLRYDF